MTEEIINDGEVPGDAPVDETVSSENPSGTVTDVKKILGLYRENMSDLAEIREMLVDYQEKLLRAERQEWVSANKVMRCLRISKSTLRRYRQTGRIRFVNINNTYRYRIV